MSLKELCNARTTLTEADILLLLEYENTLSSVADLVGADTFLDCMDKEGTAFVVAQASPAYLPSKYETKVLGLNADRQNEPAVYQVFETGLPFHDTIANTQENKAVLQNVTPIQTNGKTIAVLISERDVSREVQMERKYQAISDSIMQQNMEDSSTSSLSIRESNHRIKNNLQLMSSICRIRERATQTEEASLAYMECADMLLSVSQLHDLFTELSESKYNIDLAELLQKITKGINETLSHSKHVKIELSCDSVLISPDTAVSVAICVNELILNSLKYAFRKSGGTITIVERNGNSYCSIIVEDTGNGTDSLSMGTGLMLIKDTVINKLKGDFSITSSKSGTKSVLSFPISSL